MYADLWPENQQGLSRVIIDTYTDYSKLVLFEYEFVDGQTNKGTDTWTDACGNHYNVASAFHVMSYILLER